MENTTIRSQVVIQKLTGVIDCNQSLTVTVYSTFPNIKKSVVCDHPFTTEYGAMSA